MAITMNTAILRTPTGLFKMLELVLVFICLLIARLGLESGTTYVWQNHDLLFFVIGTLVGFVIIMPAILFAYMLGAAMPILEIVFDVIGFVLYLAIGIERASVRGGEALGAMCLITAFVFIIDFIVAIVPKLRTWKDRATDLFG